MPDGINNRSGRFADTDNQRVIINVKDVNDEPPYFINRPLPMQTVVQLNAPPNTHVFTLQARDPDTDSNIHYFIVRDRSTYELHINLTWANRGVKTRPRSRSNAITCNWQLLGRACVHARNTVIAGRGIIMDNRYRERGQVS